ncbi:MAG: DNA-3-methyladenine glycosylase I [Candidatus Pacebacteria bacterium]|nr:DNA-3-methyladenine glycosylase I [Candidatus Paceibacterota bacterium]MBP9058140.1 DNA-3-methyladenine glycosylase I [Candidatus Paceibacterota bacterium]MBP9770122.1 DNA-3-methyladenine glycosylase I [Candidatus Paceibacterota bacterium]
MKEKTRCGWCLSDQAYIKYHDEEWGRAVHSDQIHFEFITLEGAQAGLSWLTILKRRDGYRKAFKNFDPKKVSKMTTQDVSRLMKDAGIIRNRLKIESTITNAQAFIKIQKEFGSFDKYIWGFTGRKIINNSPKNLKDLKSSTPLSDEISKDLKKRGFRFVGSTIVYAYMQATGIIDDHLTTCFRKKLVSVKKG